MRRVFDLDVLACPRCGGRLRVIAPVQDPLAVQALLAHRARSGASAPPGPVPTRARRQLQALGTGPVAAAASLREGLDEPLTGLTLGLPPRLRQVFATTNCIDNLIGRVRHVTRWRDGAMIRRWVGLGLGRATARVCRVTGHRDLAALATALRTGATSEAAA